MMLLVSKAQMKLEKSHFSLLWNDVIMSLEEISHTGALRKDIIN